PFLLMIVLPYALAIPFRTWHVYGGLAAWTRYQLFPWPALLLFMAGSFSAESSEMRKLSPRGLAGFLAALVVWTAWQVNSRWGIR
ncbi:MAG TPA: hypothetical protein VNC50_12435, partial [Planctomycetia bacterium]|nr:hypothetical protein [Planctomycetia bacterium]